MKILPQMSTTIDTKPIGREWMTENDVKELDGSHVLCSIKFIGKADDDDRCRLFYDLIGSPYVSEELHRRLPYLQTSVEYTKQQLVDLVKQWGLVGKSVSDCLTAYRLFAQFCVVDGKIATKSLTKMANTTEKRA